MESNLSRLGQRKASSASVKQRISMDKSLVPFQGQTSQTAAVSKTTKAKAKRKRKKKNQVQKEKNQIDKLALAIPDTRSDPSATNNSGNGFAKDTVGPCTVDCISKFMRYPNWCCERCKCYYHQECIGVLHSSFCPACEIAIEKLELDEVQVEAMEVESFPQTSNNEESPNNIIQATPDFQIGEIFQYYNNSAYVQYQLEDNADGRHEDETNTESQLQSIAKEVIGKKRNRKPTRRYQKKKNTSQQQEQKEEANSSSSSSGNQKNHNRKPMSKEEMAKIDQEFNEMLKSFEQIDIPSNQKYLAYPQSMVMIGNRLFLAIPNPDPDLPVPKGDWNKNIQVMPTADQETHLEFNKAAEKNVNQNLCDKMEDSKIDENNGNQEMAMAENNVNYKTAENKSIKSIKCISEHLLPGCHCYQTPNGNTQIVGQVASNLPSTFTASPQEMAELKENLILRKNYENQNITDKNITQNSAEKIETLSQHLAEKNGNQQQQERQEADKKKENQKLAQKQKQHVRFQIPEAESTMKQKMAENNAPLRSTTAERNNVNFQLVDKKRNQKMGEWNPPFRPIDYRTFDKAAGKNRNQKMAENNLHLKTADRNPNNRNQKMSQNEGNPKMAASVNPVENKANFSMVISNWNPEILQKGNQEMVNKNSNQTMPMPPPKGSSSSSSEPIEILQKFAYDKVVEDIDSSDEIEFLEEIRKRPQQISLSSQTAQQQQRTGIPNNHVQVIQSPPFIPFLSIPQENIKSTSNLSKLPIKEPQIDAVRPMMEISNRENENSYSLALQRMAMSMATTSNIQQASIRTSVIRDPSTDSSSEVRKDRRLLNNDNNSTTGIKQQILHPVEEHLYKLNPSSSTWNGGQVLTSVQQINNMISNPMILQPQSSTTAFVSQDNLSIPVTNYGIPTVQQIDQQMQNINLNYQQPMQPMLYYYVTPQQISPQQTPSPPFQNLFYYNQFGQMMSTIPTPPPVAPVYYNNNFPLTQNQVTLGQGFVPNDQRAWVQSQLAYSPGPVTVQSQTFVPISHPETMNSSLVSNNYQVQPTIYNTNIYPAAEVRPLTTAPQQALQDLFFYPKPTCNCGLCELYFQANSDTRK